MLIKDNLENYQTDYRVVYEDPHEPDTPIRILHPTSEWMAMCITGWNITTSILLLGTQER